MVRMAKLNRHISGHGNKITQENIIQLIEFERARTNPHTEKKKRVRSLNNCAPDRWYAV